MSDAAPPTSDTEALATVVVVNANGPKRARLVDALEARGHRAVGYASAWAAIDSIAPPSNMVLVVDHHLPDMSGVDFIDEVRTRGLQLPTIMTVPVQAIRTAVEAIRYGAAEVLEEPLDEAVLAHAVQLVLTRKGLSPPGS